MAKVKRSGDSLKKDIEAITAAIIKNANRIREVTFNTVKGQMARRIFTQGGATDGSKIGTYEYSTQRFRREVGRQTNYVDLSMTQTLERSFGVGTHEGRTVIGIADVNEPEVTAENGRLKVTGISDFITTENAIYQEKNFGKEIFAPSKEEIKRGEQTVIKEVNIVVKQALK